MKALTCSICHKFLWCKYPHCGHFELSTCDVTIQLVREREAYLALRSPREPGSAHHSMCVTLPDEMLQWVSFTLCNKTHPAYPLLQSSPRQGGPCPTPSLSPLIPSLLIHCSWTLIEFPTFTLTLSTWPFPDFLLVIQVTSSERSLLTTLPEVATP